MGGEGQAPTPSPPKYVPASDPPTSFWLIPTLSSGKSRVRPLFVNPGKSSSGQSSSQICRMSVQLWYVQLSADKTNAADLSSGVFAILISVTLTIKHKIHCRSTNCFKNWQRRNKGSSELYCLSVAADSIFDVISFIRCIILWPENKFCPNPDLAPAGLEFLNPARSSSGRIWRSQIQYNPNQ